MNPDFDLFRKDLEKFEGLVFFEDIHHDPLILNELLAHPINKKVKLLISTWPKYSDILSHSNLPNKIAELCKTINIDRFDHSKGIIEFYYANKRPTPKAALKQEWVNELQSLTGSDLWWLAFALQGWDRKSMPTIENLQKGVNERFKQLFRRHADNPFIIRLIAQLFVDGFWTDEVFLVDKLSVHLHLSPSGVLKALDSLVNIGEIRRKERKKHVFYGLNHTSIARAYVHFGDRFTIDRVINDDFGMNYLSSKVGNGMVFLFNWKNFLYRLDSEQIANIIKNDGGANMSILNEI